MLTAKQKEKVVEDIKDKLENLGLEEIILFATSEDHKGMVSIIKQPTHGHALSGIAMIIKLLSEDMEEPSPQVARDIAESLEKAEQKYKELMKDKEEGGRTIKVIL